MKMVIKRAQKEDADIIGEVHSAAWKQTYQGVFSQEYLDSDSPSARREEFLSSLNDRHCVYLLLKDDDEMRIVSRSVAKALIEEHTTDISN